MYYIYAILLWYVSFIIPEAFCVVFKIFFMGESRKSLVEALYITMHSTMYKQHELYVSVLTSAPGAYIICYITFECVRVCVWVFIRLYNVLYWSIQRNEHTICACVCSFYICTWICTILLFHRMMMVMMARWCVRTSEKCEWPSPSTLEYIWEWQLMPYTAMMIMIIIKYISCMYSATVQLERMYKCCNVVSAWAMFASWYRMYI